MLMPSAQARRRPALGSALLIAGLMAPASAAAHGGFWQASAIHVPSSPRDGRIILQSALRGFMVSDDAGESFRWICAETLGAFSTSPFHGALLPAPDGRLLVAGVVGGLQAHGGDLCDFRPTPGLEDVFVSALARAGGEEIWATGLQSGSADPSDALYVSRDGGEHFEPTGSKLPLEIVTTSLHVLDPRPAVDAARRLYAAGACEAGLCIARSEDGGRGFALGATVPVTTRRGFAATVAELDPALPDCVLVLYDDYETSDDESEDALYVSEDGGRTLRRMFADGGALRGWARSPDGSRLLVSGRSGLHEAEVSDAVSRGREAFRTLSSVPMHAVAWTEHGIYAGFEEFSVESTGFSVGLSRDGGHTFEPVMSICAIEPLGCRPGTRGADRCPEVFSDDGRLGGGFKEDFLESDLCRDPATDRDESSP